MGVDEARQHAMTVTVTEKLRGSVDEALSWGNFQEAPSPQPTQQPPSKSAHRPGAQKGSQGLP